MLHLRSRFTVLLTTLALLAPVLSSRAAAFVNDGELFIGFYAAGGQGSSESMIVNIGSAATFRDATTGFTLNSLGSIATDLATTYGSDWNTRVDLYWGVYGTNFNSGTTVNGDPANTLYASKVQATLGTVTTPFNRGSSFTQVLPASTMNDVVNQAGVAGTNANVLIQTEDTLNNDFKKFQSGATAFNGYFQTSLGTFENGVSGTALDLHRMPTGSSSLRGTYEGTFTISSNGFITFSVIPEPSTWALILIGAGITFFALRRRVASKV